MKTYVYFWKNNGYNAVIITQNTNFYLACTGNSRGYFDNIDLYSNTAIDDLRQNFTEKIEYGDIDLSGLCIGDIVTAGNFNPVPSDTIEMIATFDYEDLTPYCNGLY